MSEKIKLTLGQIGVKDAQGAPLFMMALHKLRKHPIGGEAYALAKVIRVIDVEYATYVEAFESIVRKCGKETAPGSWVVDQKSEQYATAQAEISDLNKKEVELPIERKIRIPGVPPANPLDMLSAEDVLQLEPIAESV